MNISGIGGDDKWNLPQFRKDLEEKYKKVVDNFRIVTDALKNSLAGQERIILPVSMCPKSVARLCLRGIVCWRVHFQESFDEL